VALPGDHGADKVLLSLHMWLGVNNQSPGMRLISRDYWCWSNNVICVQGKLWSLYSVIVNFIAVFSSTSPTSVIRANRL